mgnify:CR=1 FL=1
MYNHKEKLQMIANEFPLNRRDVFYQNVCETFPFDIANESDDFYGGVLFCLHLFTDGYRSEADKKKIVLLTLIINYAWQEKSQAEKNQFPENL